MGKASQPQMQKNNGTRCLAVDAIRAMEDENPRRFELSFSSETPYMRWFGPEILDHGEGAVDLSRLNEIGVLLFNHDVDQVCGRILRAWIEERRGMAEVEFDTDDAAEVIRQKVATGTLKAVSVRYSVARWETIEAGAVSQDGFTGPCDIAREWTPLEVSIVSVPADATVGVGREMEDDPQPSWLDTCQRQLTINRNHNRLRGVK